jgi:endonuclease/exonuclease/phosphatase family metal-dependent hydrolase
MLFHNQTKTLFLAFFSISVLFSCQKKETIGITTLTYNVAGLPDVVSQSTPSVYNRIIGRLINDIGVVHTQEDFYYHDSLILENTHKYLTPYAGQVTEGDGLTTFSQYPISSIERVAWTDCSGFDCLTPKGFCYSQIQIGSELIDFYNVHATAGSDPNALIARQKNIRQLCDFIKVRSAEKPVIVMGDMNCRYTRSGDSIRNVLNLGFADSWIEMIRNGQIPAADDNSLMGCGSNGDERTNPNCEKVDKIFYRSSEKVKIYAKSYLLDSRKYYFNDNDTIPLSDHWPLFTSFIIEIEK